MGDPGIFARCLNEKPKKAKNLHEIISLIRFGNPEARNLQIHKFEKGLDHEETEM